MSITSKSRIAVIATLLCFMPVTAFAGGWSNADLEQTYNQESCIELAVDTLLSFKNSWRKLGVSSGKTMVVATYVGRADEPTSDVMILCNRFDGQVRPMLIVKGSGDEETQKSHLNQISSKFNAAQASKNKRVVTYK